LVGATGEVHAFEPVPACFSRLEKNLTMFPWAGASRVAVSDAAGTMLFRFSEDENRTGWGSLLSDGDSSMKEQVVSVVTLDDWVQTRNIRRVDFIKMDIEGAECRALQGAMKLLTRFRPIIVAELNSVCLARDGRKPADIIALLQDAGYESAEFGEGVLAMPKELGTLPHLTQNA
jgi:FkbM family methyltransferase